MFFKLLLDSKDSLSISLRGPLIVILDAFIRLLRILSLTNTKAILTVLRAVLGDTNQRMFLQCLYSALRYATVAKCSDSQYFRPVFLCVSFFPKSDDVSFLAEALALLLVSSHCLQFSQCSVSLLHVDILANSNLLEGIQKSVSIDMGPVLRGEQSIDAIALSSAETKGKLFTRSVLQFIRHYDGLLQTGFLSQVGYVNASSEGARPATSSSSSEQLRFSLIYYLSAHDIYVDESASGALDTLRMSMAPCTTRHPLQEHSDSSPRASDRQKGSNGRSIRPSNSNLGNFEALCETRTAFTKSIIREYNCTEVTIPDVLSMIIGSNSLLCMVQPLPILIEYCLFFPQNTQTCLNICRMLCNDSVVTGPLQSHIAIRLVKIYLAARTLSSSKQLALLNITMQKSTSRIACNIVHAPVDQHTQESIDVLTECVNSFLALISEAIARSIQSMQPCHGSDFRELTGNMVEFLNAFLYASYACSISGLDGRNLPLDLGLLFAGLDFQQVFSRAAIPLSSYQCLLDCDRLKWLLSLDVVSCLKRTYKLLHMLSTCQDEFVLPSSKANAILDTIAVFSETIFLGRIILNSLNRPVALSNCSDNTEPLDLTPRLFAELTTATTAFNSFNSEIIINRRSRARIHLSFYYLQGYLHIHSNSVLMLYHVNKKVRSLFLSSYAGFTAIYDETVTEKATGVTSPTHDLTHSASNSLVLSDLSHHKPYLHGESPEIASVTASLIEQEALFFDLIVKSSTIPLNWHGLVFGSKNLEKLIRAPFAIETHIADCINTLLTTGSLRIRSYTAVFLFELLSCDTVGFYSLLSHTLSPNMRMHLFEATKHALSECIAYLESLTSRCLQGVSLSPYVNRLGMHSPLITSSHFISSENLREAVHETSDSGVEVVDFMHPIPASVDNSIVESLRIFRQALRRCGATLPQSIYSRLLIAEMAIHNVGSCKIARLAEVLSPNLSSAMRFVAWLKGSLEQVEMSQSDQPTVFLNTGVNGCPYHSKCQGNIYESLSSISRRVAHKIISHFNCPSCVRVSTGVLAQESAHSGGSFFDNTTISLVLTGDPFENCLVNADKTLNVKAILAEAAESSSSCHIVMALDDSLTMRMTSSGFGFQNNPFGNLKHVAHNSSIIECFHAMSNSLTDCESEFASLFSRHLVLYTGFCIAYYSGNILKAMFLLHAFIMRALEDGEGNHADKKLWALKTRVLNQLMQRLVEDVMPMVLGPWKCMCPPVIIGNNTHSPPSEKSIGYISLSSASMYETFVSDILQIAHKCTAEEAKPTDDMLRCTRSEQLNRFLTVLANGWAYHIALSPKKIFNKKHQKLGIALCALDIIISTLYPSTPKRTSQKRSLMHYLREELHLLYYFSCPIEFHCGLTDIIPEISTLVTEAAMVALECSNNRGLSNDVQGSNDVKESYIGFLLPRLITTFLSTLPSRTRENEDVSELGGMLTKFLSTLESYVCALAASLSFQSMAKTAGTAISLSLDISLSRYPFEHCKGLFCGVAVSRASSLQADIVIPKNNKHAHGYIIDPLGDLSSTRAGMVSLVQDLPGTWSGCAGLLSGSRRPLDILRACSNGVFLFSGHGSGESVLPLNLVQQLSTLPECVLMGCSSLSLIPVGQHLSMGPSLYYARSPLLIGCLWDTYSSELDKLTMKFLTTWMTSTPKTSVCEALRIAIAACRLNFLVGMSVTIIGHAGTLFRPDYDV